MNSSQLCFNVWIVLWGLLSSGIRKKYVWAVLVLAGLGGIQRASGQSDDFDDGNDTGWVRFDLNSGTGGQLPGASYTFPDDGFGGKAYHILTPAPPVPNAGPARAFSYRTNVYDNFYVAVDVVGWDNSLNQAFGFLIRASNIALGQTTGYVMNYDPNQGAGGRGQFQINSITNEAPTTIAAANISLDPTHRYRFVMTGVASTLTAKIYDFLDLTTPLVTISTEDSQFPQGVLGVFDFSRVNAASYTNAITGKADVTFDNYYASSTAPPSSIPPGTPHPIPDMPHVASHDPAPRANFYSYTNGISFTAKTLTMNAINTNALKLFLNGADVSSGLAMSGTASNVDVTFSGLVSNAVYDARIVLSDFSGRSSTNEFTFDTFDEGYFDSPTVKIIEAEDYNNADNFGNGGQFQDNPPPSGTNSMGFVVNGFGDGYYDLIGKPSVDYFDRSTSFGTYRTQDSVDTQAGSVEIESTLGDLALNDTIRQKYAALDLQEYEVGGTEGGEWLNYTRSFSNGNYRVYLREASRAPQAVSLDKVISDPAQTNQTTTALGVFNVPSTAMISNYRYVSLTDTNGSPAVLNLSGTNTLRLTLGGAQTNVTQQTMALNYLLFVPVPATATAPTLSQPVRSGNDLVFLCQTTSGFLYTVQYKDSLDQTNWMDSVTFTGDGSSRAVTNAVVGASRFFRVSVH